jgi:hypothetical protein
MSKIYSGVELFAAMCTWRVIYLQRPLRSFLSKCARRLIRHRSLYTDVDLLD